MAIPHNFPTLLDPDQDVTVIMGSGMSFNLAPNVNEYRDALKEYADQLHLDTTGDLYDLAQRIIDYLSAEKTSDQFVNAKYMLAKNSGMLNDARWVGNEEIRLNGSTPRHRALARFVVEEQIGAVISLNWDTLFESTLDSCGLTDSIPQVRPWRITNYVRVIDDKDVGKLGMKSSIPILKPHGCVRDMLDKQTLVSQGKKIDSFVFKLTKDEMNENTNQENLVDEFVNLRFKMNPLIGIGWGASENYLRKAIEKHLNLALCNQQDNLTIIDIDYNQNHIDLAEKYGKTEKASYCQVKPVGKPTADCLLQWLYAKFSLRQLVISADNEYKTNIQNLLDGLVDPSLDSKVQHLLDYWLPTWVRICWKLGAVEGRNPITAERIEPKDIPISPKDIHIPITGMGIERKDLRFAAQVIATLPTPVSQFDFTKYPGGIYSDSEEVLYLPVPGWTEAIPSSSLNAFKPLIEGLSNFNFVDRVKLVLIGCDDPSIADRKKAQILAQIQSSVRIASLAETGAIEWATPDEIGAI